jgi:uncharacterized membrane protein YfcA
VQDWLLISFSLSGVQTWLWLPLLAAFLVSSLTAVAGVSGAFLLLPFQFSVLGYTDPGVTGTNLIYNLVATPGGIYRYLREDRMLWPLVWVVSLGVILGFVVGCWIRVNWLADAQRFQLFAGVLLALLAVRLLVEVGWHGAGGRGDSNVRDRACAVGVIGDIQRKGLRMEFAFAGRRWGFSLTAMVLLSACVGVVGGAYGIGGGAILAPLCVIFFRLPIHAIAGATLAATFLSSLVGVVLYQLLPAPAGVTIAPDWHLGLLFGSGGFFGTYAGARLQKFLPQVALQLLLGLLLLTIGLYYLVVPHSA